MITQSFDLNMIPESEPVIVHVNQYDEGTGRFVISLYNGTSLYSPSNATVKVQGTKPDKHGFQYNASISGSTVTVDLERQMTAVAGDVRTQILVTEQNGVTGTFVFIMRVQESALEDDTDISETELPDIIDAAETNAERAEAAVKKYPKIIDEYWWVWNASQGQWENTYVRAKGADGAGSIVIDNHIIKYNGTINITNHVISFG